MVDLRFRDIVRFSCGCNMVADFELKKLVKPLQDWFDGHARVLPWRDDPKAYKVWISEIMLQQTRVEAVKPYFARFMEALPDVEALAACPEDRYLKLWEGLGYYNRVRNLHAAAEQIMEQYGGTIPDTVEELLRLKGIGSYTAGAIASIAYNRPVPAALFIAGSFLHVRVGACFLVLANQEREKRGLPNVQVHDTTQAIATTVDAIRLLIQEDKDADRL